SRPAVGPALPVPADGALHAFRVVRVTDARAVRGFLHPPIDGSLDSRDWDGRFWEYPSPGPGAGVYYEHPYRNDGLHVTLADCLGVGAIQVRGGVRALVVAEAASFEDSASGTLAHTFPGRATASLARFDPPVRARHFSFFGVRDGYIADLAFFRAADPASLPGAPATWSLRPGDPAALPGDFLAERFGPDPGEVLAAFAPAAAGAPLAKLTLAAGRPVHLVAGPFAADTAITAVGLTFRVAGLGGAARLTLQVQEPVYPRTAASTALFDLSGPGPVRLALDLPDLVLPAGTPLWITLVPEADLELSEPALDLWLAAPAAVAAEAFDRALLKLKGCFGVVSEPRPWTGLRPGTDVDAFLAARGRLAPQLFELRAFVDYCRWLGPDDDVARQYYQWFYRGKLRPALPPAVLPDEPGAPRWAVAARTAWLEARAVPHWWLTHRDVPGGELGSGIGDDTDMYGNYIDFPFFETGGVAAELADGSARLAELIDRYQLDEGLNRMVTDPLHAYEEGANHVALMARWRYGDPVYFERCLDNARSTWALTTVNGAGHRHFKSQVQGAADLRFDRPTDVDGTQHPLMLHGVCEVVWYNRNPEALRLLQEWGDAWLAHHQPGEYATDVEVATDRVTGSSRVPWNGGYGSQGEVYKFLYQATRDPQYLEPVRRFWEGGGRDSGLDQRAVDLYQLAAFDDAPELYEALAPRCPALEWTLHGDKAGLLSELDEAAAEIQTFGHLYTAAEVFTDRVFLAAATRAPTLAYTGGYGTRNKLFHSHGASWEGFGTQYAALVRTCRPDRFQALVYSFADQPLRGSVRLWNAEHGRYRLRVGPDADGDDALDRAVVSKVVEVRRGEPIAVELPPRQVTVIELEQEKALDPLWQRADLALSALEVAVRDGAVEGVVHNIGSAEAPAVVALVDPRGNVRTRQELGSLAAPLDLRPRRVPFRLEGAPADPAGWQVVVDPGDRVPELYEGNNAVSLGP
ncbi:MAG: hypothetical protein ABIL09_18845, partial [Gemmatimonadota bacterium]